MNDVSGHGNTSLQFSTDFPEVGDVTAEQVGQFLVENPDFFIQHPSILQSLQIPHAQKGSVSLVELQSEQMRKKVRLLNYKLSQLISIAKQNEKIYRAYAELNLRLLKCKDISDILLLLQETLQEELSLASVELKMFKGANALPELQKRLFMEKRFKQTPYFFGRLSQHEKQLMFGDQTAESTALILLGDNNDLGILAVGSHSADHFTPDMDTLLLNQLREVLNVVLPEKLRY
ncbi:DUF484 family protein [Alteromonas gilva]|uniref:DUF484 family protein n=1 Tax=Alteromonas gilva TaxID=2987522 RepID=A0ABT5L1C9_9ALTE|nr:DUF484 family protein [Alteromonas gilva]MDC8829613.1 DUF484 family protein [Alteromonas gilva]